MVYVYYKYFSDAANNASLIFMGKLDVLMVSMDFTENSVVTEYPYHFRATGLNINGTDSIVLATECTEGAQVYASWSTENVEEGDDFEGEQFRVVFDNEMASHNESLRLCYKFSRYDVYANLQSVTINPVVVSTDSNQYFATRGDLLEITLLGNFPQSSENEISLLLSTSSSCDTSVINYSTFNQNTFYFLIEDVTSLEYFVCLRWDQQSSPRVIENTVVHMMDLSSFLWLYAS